MRRRKGGREVGGNDEKGCDAKGRREKKTVRSVLDEQRFGGAGGIIRAEF